MRNNKKKGILVLVLLLAIGFAAISTTLTINGAIKIGANTDDITENVKFTSATLTHTDEDGKAATTGTAATISSDGKTIAFTTNELTMVGEKAKLVYTVTNGSQYDVNLSDLTCTVKDADSNDVTSTVVGSTSTGYIKVTVDSLAQSLASGGATDGTDYIEVELVKSYASETATSYTITCETTASAS